MLIILPYPLELQLDYYPTKSQSDWMCGIYTQSSVCMYHLVCLSAYPVICTCIAFPLTPTLGGGDVKL